MARVTTDLLADIRSGCADATEYAGGLDLDGLTRLPLEDQMRYRALKNALTEIGEAIRMRPPRLIADHPQVRWRGFVGLRNVVAHQYFALEPEVLHAILTDEVPKLAETVALVAQSDLSRYDRD